MVGQHHDKWPDFKHVHPECSTLTNQNTKQNFPSPVSVTIAVTPKKVQEGNMKQVHILISLNLQM
jgi:hypothetical protein